MIKKSFGFEKKREHNIFELRRPVVFLCLCGLSLLYHSSPLCLHRKGGCNLPLWEEQDPEGDREMHLSEEGN